MSGGRRACPTCKGRKEHPSTCGSVLERCRTCRGSGVDPGEPAGDDTVGCPYCEGSGRLKVVAPKPVDQPGNPREPAKHVRAACPVCKGAGDRRSIYNGQRIQCKGCDGTGRVWTTAPGVTKVVECPTCNGQ